MKPFNNRHLIWELGKVQGERHQPEELNRVLVGRETERGRFLRMLLNHAHKTSYLITGSRGSGKTSFVNYCMRSYEHNFYARFMSSPRGRVWFWDKMLALLMVVLFSLCYVGLFELYILLAINFSNVAFPLLFVVSVVFSWPLIESVKLFVFLDSNTRRNKDRVLGEEGGGRLGGEIKRFGLLAWWLIFSCVCSAFLFVFFGEVHGVVSKYMCIVVAHVFGPLVFVVIYWVKGDFKAEDRVFLVKSYFMFEAGAFPLVLMITAGVFTLFGGEDVIRLVGAVPWLFPMMALTLLLAVGIMALSEYRHIVRKMGVSDYRRSSSSFLIPFEGDGKRNYVHHTFAYVFNRHWFPLMTIRVNLGFDQLDYRRVTEAMLLGLKHEFYKAFLSYSSFVGNLNRVLLVFSISMLTFRFRDQVFNGVQSSREMAGNVLSDLTYVFNSIMTIGLVRLDPEDVYFKVLRIVFNDVDGRKVLYVVDVAHVVIFFLLFYLYKKIALYSPFTPYWRIYKDIDDLLSSLSGRRQSSVQEKVKLSIARMVGEATEQTSWNMDPMDPRTVEIRLMKILTQIRDPGVRLPGEHLHRVTLPSAEVTFVFDELDKLGTVPLEMNRHRPSKDKVAEDKHDMYRLSQRPLEVQELLANMKNLLSEGDARFVFIGGRDLHDEWVADRTLRQPFLSNIFEAEIYLPSLLTDHLMDFQNDNKPNILNRVDEFLSNYHWQAQRISKNQTRDWKMNFVLDFVKPVYPPMFSDNKTRQMDKHNEDAQMDSVRVLSDFPCDKQFSSEFYGDFVKFLALRSSGNPRQLRGVIDAFVLDMESWCRKDELENQTLGFRWLMDLNVSPPVVNIIDNGKCELKDVLCFSDEKQYRILFISHVYDMLSDRFEQKFASGDDKPIVTLFYLANFVLKFHRRSFSWSGMERIDELMHIHRSTETRGLIKALLDDWSDRCLVRLHTGIYDFRFHADFEAELRYLSRVSQNEMAAFNFTLDESRHLKEIYHELIQQPGEREQFEHYNALGELYEYDSDYERARSMYQQAMRALDNATFPRGEAITDWSHANNHLRLALETGSMANVTVWVINRLRLMLRIAMTYEFRRSFETARICYHDCTRFARAFIDEWLPRYPYEERGRKLFEKSGAFWAKGSRLGNSKKFIDDSFVETDLIKNLKILFLPVFSEAWVSEKLSYSVDAAPDIIVNDIKEFTGRIRQFLSDTNLSKSRDDVKHITYRLILAEFYHRSGDLFFFKGREIPLPNECEAMERNLSCVYDNNESTDRQSDDLKFRSFGYLLAASREYLLGLHEIRRFQHSRVASSGGKYGVESNETDEGFITLKFSRFPDFLSRTISGLLLDFSLSILSRVSIYNLVYKEMSCVSFQGFDGLRCVNYSSVGKLEGDVSSEIENWISCLDENESMKVVRDFFKGEGDSKPSDEVLGACQESDAGKIPQSNCSDKVLASVNFWLIACKILSGSGYHNQSVKSYLQLVEVIHNLMISKMILMRNKEFRYVFDIFLGDLSSSSVSYSWIKCFKGTEFDSTMNDRLWVYLKEVANYALFHAFRQVVELNRGDGASSRLRLKKELVKCGFVNSICYSNILWPGCDFSDSSCGDRISLAQFVEILLEKKTGSGFSGVMCPKGAYGVLEEAVQTYSFPMACRIKGIKNIVDSACLGLIKVDSSALLFWVEALLSLNEKFNDHGFSSNYSQGVSLALFAIFREGKAFSSIADKYLYKSQQMYTMGKAYYSEIADLYFLFEDFNDHDLHFSHGLQMMSAELILVLRLMMKYDSYCFSRDKESS